LLFPIAGKASERERFFVEMPETEKRRSGVSV
jgi:hypothetical protein